MQAKDSDIQEAINSAKELLENDNLSSSSCEATFLSSREGRGERQFAQMGV